MEAMKM